MCVVQAGRNVFVEIIIDADGYVVLASSCDMAAEIIQVRIVVTAGKQNRMWVFRHYRYCIECIVSIFAPSVGGIGGLGRILFDFRVKKLCL